MKNVRRATGAITALTMGLLLCGCSGGSLNSFDPTDLFDFLNTEKKLPGERRAVFPEGVPGVERGVPEHLVKGANPAGTEPQQAPQAVATPPAAAEPAPPKPRRSAAAAPRRRAAPPPPPAEPDDAEPAEETRQPGQGSSFPAPLPSGSFQR